MPGCPSPAVKPVPPAALLWDMVSVGGSKEGICDGAYVLLSQGRLLPGDTATHSYQLPVSLGAHKDALFGDNVGHVI